MGLFNRYSGGLALWKPMHTRLHNPPGYPVSGALCPREKNGSEGESLAEKFAALVKEDVKKRALSGVLKNFL